MKFSNYLNEDFEPISRYKLQNILTTKCKQNWEYIKKTNKIIYRGDNALDSDDYYIFTEWKNERKSANTSNYYTLLFSDILQSWKQFPKRNKSLICTTSKNKADDYGYIYCVVPYDDVKIGICNYDDIWDILENQYIWYLFLILDKYPSLDTFNNFIKTYSKDNKTDLMKLMNKSIIEHLKQIQKSNNEDKILYALLLNYTEGYDKDSSYILKNSLPDLDMKYSNITFGEVLEYHLNPIKLGMRLGSYKTIKRNVEVWMEGPCVLIRKEIMNDLLEEI